MPWWHPESSVFPVLLAPNKPGLQRDISQGNVMFLSSNPLQAGRRASPGRRGLACSGGPGCPAMGLRVTVSEPGLTWSLYN